MIFSDTWHEHYELCLKKFLLNFRSNYVIKGGGARSSSLVSWVVYSH